MVKCGIRCSVQAASQSAEIEVSAALNETATRLVWVWSDEAFLDRFGRVRAARGIPENLVVAGTAFRNGGAVPRARSAAGFGRGGFNSGGFREPFRECRGEEFLLPWNGAGLPGSFGPWR